MRKTTDFKRFSIDWVCDWEQIVGKWNWYEFHLIQLSAEKEMLHGTAEIEIYILGFGIRLYWVWNKKRMNRKMKEYSKLLKEGKWTSKL